jgi:DNA-binding transcriptional regulator YiaG
MTPDNLKAIREELGLSQAEFADRVGYSAKAIQNFEHGRQLITKALENHALLLQRFHRIKKALENSC